jgi:hypothetical protein
MTRSTLRRLAKLEAKQPDHHRPWHSILLEEDEDETPRIAALVASGKAKETDNFMLIRRVSPNHDKA